MAVRLLESHGWTQPPAESLPTGRELIDAYLQPLAQTPAVAEHLVLDTRVISVTRDGMDKVKSAGRSGAPFIVRVEDRFGTQTDHRAAAVIDASGTWASPNPLGAAGVPAAGEESLGKQIWYGIPDVLIEDRAAFAGKSTLVVGAGHSAANVILDLIELADTEAAGVIWAVRGGSPVRAFGGGDADELAARGRLGRRLQIAVDAGRLELLVGFAVSAVEREPSDRVIVHAADGRDITVDQVVAATGQRPDLAMTRELRLELDPWLESPVDLAPLIDPNLHSCGTVAPHGYDVLSHPEPGFFIAGIKSYGRAPTFLTITGYEQVRSIVAALAGDFDAARNLELVLPETGVCVTDFGGPTAEDACFTSDTPLITTISSGNLPS